METNELKKLDQHMQALEKELAERYQLLGKRTQEFTQKESEKINHLVDEIVIIKQKIKRLENTIVTD